MKDDQHIGCIHIVRSHASSVHGTFVLPLERQLSGQVAARVQIGCMITFSLHPIAATVECS
jgi:hypothetical protein